MTRGEGGFATTEFALGVGLLLLPTLLLVALVPRWSEARLAAATAADAASAAGALAVAAGLDSEASARDAAHAVLTRRGVVGDVRVDVTLDRVAVEVEVALPTFPMVTRGRDPLEAPRDPLVLGGLTTTARSVQLVDPYRGPAAGGAP